MTTTETTPAHVEPKPPPTGLAKVWKHFTDWATIYFWLPMGLLAVWLFARFTYFITGHKPQESMDFVVGFSWNLVICIFAIFFTEVTRQQTGNWWKPEDLKSNANLLWSQTVSKCVTLVAFLYFLSR